MSDYLVKQLRYGIVEHRKRWSGDTHADLGGSVDYDATTDMLSDAADRIEELEAKVAKVIDELQEIASLGRCDFSKVRATLAELKGKKDE